MEKLVLIFIFLGVLAYLVDPKGVKEKLPEEYYEDFVRTEGSDGKAEFLKTITHRSEKSDTRFYPPYFLGLGIKDLCITSSSDYQPCLRKYALPNFSAPKKHKISYYVWESDARAAVGFFVSTYRGTALKHNLEFEELKTLEKLRIIGCGITSLSDAFYDSHEVVELDLRSNDLKKLMGSNFLGMKKLKKLNLSGNQISSIKEDTFNSLEVLEEIDLSGNSLKSLDWKIFKQQRSLSTLILSDSKLENIVGFKDGRVKEHGESTELQKAVDESTDDRRPFADALRNLKRLELQRNNLTSIDQLVARIPAVEYFDVSENRLEEISRTSFAGLWKLKTLLLNGNRLQFPHKEWFYIIVRNAKSGQATQVDVSNNHWKCNCQILVFNDYCVKNLADNNLQSLLKSMHIRCNWPGSLEGRYLHEVAETIRVEYECPSPSQKENAKYSRERQNYGVTEAQHIGFQMSDKVAITLIVAILIYFILQYLERHNIVRADIWNRRAHPNKNDPNINGNPKPVPRQRRRNTEQTQREENKEEEEKEDNDNEDGGDDNSP